MMSLQDDEILAEEDDLNDLKKNLQSKSFRSYTNQWNSIFLWKESVHLAPTIKVLSELNDRFYFSMYST